MSNPPAQQQDDQRRRSQSERRADTIELLLDATIATISEVGYHHATTAEICARAGVTHGALFHHFETRIDLVLASLQRMTEDRVARYVEFAEGVRAAAGDPLDLLRMVGELARDDVATVWAEVTIAARTDPELRDRLEPAIIARWALIRAAAAAFPGLATMDPRQRDVWLELLRGTIELAPVIDPLSASGPADGLEEGRNRALIKLAGHLGAQLTVDGSR